MENSSKVVQPLCAFCADAGTGYSKTGYRFFFGEKHGYTNLFHET